MRNRDYEKLLARGNNILAKVMPELNRISEDRIRKDNGFRRQEDCEEIAIALALYDEFIDGLLV